MSDRRTEIVDIELSDTDEFQDEIFSKLLDAFKDEQRLLKRFFDFCDEYNHFEFDEMGINMDEADDVLRKTYKIRDLLLSHVEDKLLYIFDDVESDTLSKTIFLNFDLEEKSFKLIIEVMSDSFNLELV